MKIFPTYSEVVRVVFGQVLSNQLFEKIDTPLQLRAHAEFVSVINTLIPSSGKIEFELNQYDAFCQVEIKDTSGTIFFIRVEADIESLEMTSYVV